MGLFRPSITEETARDLIDAVDHLSACIADLVDVVSRNTAVSERVGGWTPPERRTDWSAVTEAIDANVARNVRLRQYYEGAPAPTTQAVLDLTSARRHAEDRTDAEAQTDDDTPLIEHEACS